MIKAVLPTGNDKNWGTFSKARVKGAAKTPLHVQGTANSKVFREQKWWFRRPSHNIEKTLNYNKNTFKKSKYDSPDLGR